jgi:hypothetical protein
MTPAEVEASVADFRREYGGWQRPLSLMIFLLQRPPTRASEHAKR